MDKNSLTSFRDSLLSIKKEGVSLAQYCKNSGKDRSYYSYYVAKAAECIDESKELVTEILTLYSELSERTSKYAALLDKEKSESSPLDGVTEEIIEEAEEVDDFDGVTNVTYRRSSETNKIISYLVQVKVRDKTDFITTLSRQDAENIFGLYTYYGGNITARNVANEFPRYTLPEIKKIFRAFKLTKDSPWFPPHLGEELTEEQLSKYRMNLKERAAFKYADARQERDFKNSLNKMASEINRLSNFKGQIKEILEEFSSSTPIEAKKFPKVRTQSDGTLMLFLADMHIGAKVNDQAIYKNHYDFHEVLRRIEGIAEHLSQYNSFKKLVVVNMGDALDGMDNQTARRDHFIPQNMNNFEQINNYVKAVDYLFHLLIENNLAGEYSYISVPCGNHDGAFGYAAAQLAASTLKLKYPEIETEVAEKFYLRYDVDSFTYLLCHGKDEQYMRSGFKINLDDNTELKINQYIDSLSNVRPNINVVSGDLHNEAMSRGKKFKYYKVGSFFGSSEYCMYGWGNTPAHVNYHIINGDTMLNGTIELKNNG